MAKTAAEKQKAYRERQKVTRDGNGNAPNSNETVTDSVTLKMEDLVVDPDKTTVQVSSDGKMVEVHETATIKDLPADVQVSDEPLAVYSPEHWTRLQELGYQWDVSVNRALRRVPLNEPVPWRGRVAPPVPGDPAYCAMDNIDPMYSKAHLELCE